METTNHERGSEMEPVTVRITVDVVVHDEAALDDHLFTRLFAGDRDGMKDVLDGYEDRTAGMVAEALVICSPAPLDIGIEILETTAILLDDAADD